MGVERVLDELGDCVTEGCDDERGAKAEGDRFGERADCGSFGGHCRMW